MRTIGSNLLWGVRRALFVSAVFSAYALLLYLVGGPASFDRHNTTLPLVVLVYFMGGIVAGVVVGLLRPITRWRVGAVLVGIVAAVPVYAGGMLGYERSLDLSGLDWAGVMLLAAPGGGMVGFLVWTRNYRPSTTSQGNRRATKFP